MLREGGSVVRDRPMFRSRTTRSGDPEEGIASVSEFRRDSPTVLTTEDMIYRGEGNANIVVTRRHERKVIRFRKSLLGEASPDGGLARVQREAVFVGDVVSCFLGTYAQIPEIVRCDAADVARLMDVIRPLRPEKRRRKEVVNTYATRYPDYSFLNSRLTFNEAAFRSYSTFSVEIKPKQGYLPKADRRFSRCPYCLHQYAKLRTNDIAARSDYCPFDLFSGVEERMKTAVRQLLRLPQNNLKIFKDGLVVYDQHSSASDLEDVLDEWFRDAPTGSRNGRARADEFCNLIYAALTRSFTREKLELSAASRLVSRLSLPADQVSMFRIESDAIASRIEKYLRFVGKNCDFDSDELPKDSVLGRIRDMQRLSYVNTDYIYSIYSIFGSLLNDDMIYLDLMKLSASTIFHSDLRENDTITQKLQTIKEAHLQTCFKGTIVRECNNSLNGNYKAESECVLSANTDRMLVNGDFVSQTEISPDLNSPSFYGNERPHNQEANNSESDKRKANTLTIAEHLSALQNYLLFTTARDCSILMTFRELHPESASQAPVENTIKLSEQLYFLSDAKVLDLDPKNVHCIEKHRQRDLHILDSIIFLMEENILLKNR